MEETIENINGRQNTETYCVQNPCRYIQVAIKTLLKCLGFETENSSTFEEKDKEGVGETSSQEPPADLPATEPPPADPPEAAADPPFINVLARMPSRPPIGRGRGGQTN